MMVLIGVVMFVVGLAALIGLSQLEGNAPGQSYPAIVVIVPMAVAVIGAALVVIDFLWRAAVVLYG